MNETWDDIETINPFLEKMGGVGGYMYMFLPPSHPPLPFLSFLPL